MVRTRAKSRAYPLHASRAASDFPPYDFWQTEYPEPMRKPMAHLERLYDKATTQAWDSKKMLRDLIEKHGGIRLSEPHKRALQPLMMSLLWGEMAAWIIALQLADKLPNREAKMGATGQAFDEARHFYALRAYCKEAGIPVGGMDPFSLGAVRRAIETEDLIGKVLCMQILIEAVALAVFGELRRANLDPVLTDLLKYFERDEARHISLGATYVPQAMAGVGRLRKLRYMALQARLTKDIFLGGVDKEEQFRQMGFTNEDLMRNGMKLARKIHGEMVAQLGSGFGFLKPDDAFYLALLRSRVPQLYVAQRRARMRIRTRLAAPVRRLLRRPGPTERFFARYSPAA